MIVLLIVIVDVENGKVNLLMVFFKTRQNGAYTG